MLKKIKVKRTRVHSNKNHVRHGRKVNKNIRHSKKHTKKNLQLHAGGGGFASYDNQMPNAAMGNNGKKEKFQVTTFRSINQDDLDRFKISNYVNNNVDYGSFPGAPPVDCCIM